MTRSNFKEKSFQKIIIDFFRGLLKFKVAENILYQLTEGKNRRSLAWKLVPAEYLYPKNSLRLVARNNIKYELDLSNYNDHAIFYRDIDPNLYYLFSHVNSDFIVFDIGANIGFTTLNFAKRCTRGSVYSFEPDSENYKRLQHNVSLNDLTNVELIKKGLGSESKRAKLIKHPHHSGMNRISSSYTEGEFELIDIVKLDDEVSRLGITRLNLIKIDVEGYEWNVLQGATDTLQKFRPILFIELIERNIIQQGNSSETILNWLTKLGYNIIDMKTRLPIQNSTPQDPETDVLCFPI